MGPRYSERRKAGPARSYPYVGGVWGFGFGVLGLWGLGLRMQRAKLALSAVVGRCWGLRCVLVKA